MIKFFILLLHQTRMDLFYKKIRNYELVVFYFVIPYWNHLPFIIPSPWQNVIANGTETLNLTKRISCQISWSNIKLFNRDFPLALSLVVRDNFPHIHSS